MTISRSKANDAFTVLEIIIVVTILVILAAIAIPNYIKAGPAVKTRACIANLRTIDAAKEIWALKNKKKAGDPVIPSEVNNLIKGSFGPCPADGRYEYQPVDAVPTCTVVGHSI
jgi:prepilin-type N-terminal cleavage/methylation domain-containing protein